MSSAVTVRFVTRQDYEQWLPLWDGYNAFYGRSGPTALAGEITPMTRARFFDAYQPVHALVAQSGGATLRPRRFLFLPSPTPVQPTGFLQGAFLHPRAARQTRGAHPHH